MQFYNQILIINARKEIFILIFAVDYEIYSWQTSLEPTWKFTWSSNNFVKVFSDKFQERSKGFHCHNLRASRWEKLKRDNCHGPAKSKKIFGKAAIFMVHSSVATSVAVELTFSWLIYLKHILKNSHFERTSSVAG